MKLLLHGKVNFTFLCVNIVCFIYWDFFYPLLFSFGNIGEYQTQGLIRYTTLICISLSITFNVLFISKGMVPESSRKMEET